MAMLSLVQSDRHVLGVDETTARAARALQDLAAVLPASDVLRHPVELLGLTLAARVPIPRRPDLGAVEEFLPVVLENDRERGVRERVDIRSTYEEALADAEERAARWRRAKPSARAAVLRRRVGPWETM